MMSSYKSSDWQFVTECRRFVPLLKGAQHGSIWIGRDGDISPESADKQKIKSKHI